MVKDTATQKDEIQNYDVIIVGGGLAGLSLACLLGRHGIKLACIDLADPETKPKDMRTTVISYGSRAILDRSDVWKYVPQSAPIKDIEILDGGSSVLLEFLSEEVDGRSFGWNVDNHDFKTALMKRMGEMDNIHHIAPARVVSYETGETAASVTLDNGETLEAALIIGADGRGSKTRDYMARNHGLHTRGWSYEQRAVICNVIHENPHDNIAVEHFFGEGPFAVLPVSDDESGNHRSSVVFTEHGHERNSLMRLSDEEFELALAAKFPARYGDVKMNGKRMAYPLSLVHADRYIAPRMVLVADAAHGIHPIAGQGLNLGIRDLGVLDDLLGLAFVGGEDLGAAELLERYQRARRFDNMSMAAMTDGLNRLFSNNIPPVRLARKIGLRAISKLKPAKRFLMKQAMGDR